MGKKQQPVDVDEFMARLQQDAHVAAAIKEHQDIESNLLTVEAQIWRMEETHHKMMFQSGNALKGYDTLTVINAQHPKKQQVKDEERVFSLSSRTGQSEAVRQRAMAAAQQPLATAPSLAASAEPSALAGSAPPSA